MTLAAEWARREEMSMNGKELERVLNGVQAAGTRAPYTYDESEMFCPSCDGRGEPPGRGWFRSSTTIHSVVPPCEFGREL